MVRLNGEDFYLVLRWAAENEMIPPAVYQGLLTVSGLRRGRCEVRESPPVRPVPEAHVEAVLPHTSRQVAVMVKLQRYTGMRPCEVTIMRGCDLDTTGKAWAFRPGGNRATALWQPRAWLSEDDAAGTR